MKSLTWPPQSVETEPQDLSALLAKSGLAQNVAGNTPFLLDRPEHATFVASGTVDLFLVECADGRPSGIRQYCCSFEAGDLLFGIKGAAGLPEVGFLAVGVVGTRIVDLPLDDLRAFATAPGLQVELADGIDRWIVALCEFASRTVMPGPMIDLVLGAGEAQSAQANQRLSAGPGIGWITAEASEPLFLDSQEIAAADEGTPFPLCARSWLTLGRPARVTCVDTAAVLCDGRLWAGLCSLNEAVIEAAPLALRLGAADEANRLRTRLASDESALAQGLDRLQSVVTPNAAAPVASPGNDALFAACDAVAGTLGVVLERVEAQAFSDRPPDLDDILRANQLRKRAVVLDSGWWRRDVGSFLLLGGQPAAVLRVGNRYVIRQGATGQGRPLKPAEAARLQGEAYLLYAPLPAEPLSGCSILSNALLWGRADLATLVGFGILGSLLALAPPIATGYMVDTLIPSGDVAGLAELAGVLFVVAALQFLVSLTLQRSVLRLEGRTGARLQAAIIDRLLRMPTRFFRDFTIGDLASRTLAIQRIEAVLTGAVVSSFLGGIFALISFALMLYYSLTLGAVAIAIAIVYAAMIAGFCLARMRHEREVTRLRGSLSGEMLEVTTGIAKIRFAAAEQRAFGRWAGRFADLERRTTAAKRIDMVSEVAGFGFVTLSQGLIFAIIVYAGLLETGFGLGTLIAFLAALGQGMSGVARLSQVALTVMALRPMLLHAQPILSAVPEATGRRLSPGLLSGAIDLSHVTFRYEEGAPPVFQDLSLQVRPGEYVALVGPSGCGKSTIVRLLLNFETPESGVILFDGKDQRGLDMGAVRRQMGVVLQSSRLIGTSMMDNILGANVALGENEAWRAAALAGLDEDIRAMPMGLQTIIGNGTLSGGQLQRVAIARALIHNPRVVIFDEATSALDNRTQAIITASLERIRATRIIVAHRLSTVVAADRIVVLDEGRIVESGSYTELMQLGGLFAQLAERQVTQAPGTTPGKN